MGFAGLPVVPPRIDNAKAAFEAERQRASVNSVIEMAGVELWAPGGKMILQGIDWNVRAGEHWALIGPNGSGKSTLLSIAGAQRHPSRGVAVVVGERMGATDVWALRERIGALNRAQTMYAWFTVEEIVLTGATGTVQPRWECYGEGEIRRARALMTMFGSPDLHDRPIGECSQGERQRARIA